MKAEIEKKKDSLCSETTASKDEPVLPKQAKICPKPLDDPDSPPELLLEEDGEEKKDNFSMKSLQRSLEGDFSPEKRARTKSEDSDSITIIGFLGKKTSGRHSSGAEPEKDSSKKE